MIRKLVSTAIHERKITFFVVVLLIIFGIYSYYITPKQESPDINAPFAIITAVYPGASPEDVEMMVTEKIEDKVMEIDGYNSVDSISRNSLSVVILRLDQGTDTDKAWSKLREKMSDLQSQLPRECQELQVNTDVVETAGMMISISGDAYSYEELTAFAEDLKSSLGGIQGISRFDITGKQNRVVEVEIDIPKLNYYDLSLEDVSKIIGMENMAIPAGDLDDGNSKITVKAPGPYGSLKEIEDTIVAVSGSSGSVVRLRDIANVHMALKESGGKIKYNGKNAVLLTGYCKDNKNIVLIGGEIDREIQKFQKELPQGVSLDKVMYKPQDVSDSINNFILNLVEGMLFVIIVVFFGMGIRNAVIVSTVIPLSVLITFSIMNMMGIKIHQVSIAALIVALGMLVDNAIVVSDAIQVRLDRGEVRMSACVEGVKEVALPVLTSTLTTVGAFTPLLMLSSLAGEYVRSIPQIIIISLSASYLVALFVTPALAYLVFRKSNGVEKKTIIRRFFNTILEIAMNRKWIPAVGLLIGIAAAVFAALQLGLQFFPKAEKNIIYIDIKAEQNMDLLKTESIVDEVSQILKKHIEITDTTAAIGNGLPKFFATLPIYTPSEDFAQILCKVDLKRGNRFHSYTQLVEALQEDLDSAITGGEAAVKQLEQGEPIGNPIRIRVYGDNLDRIKQAADEVEQRLGRIPGTINFGNDDMDETYEFSLNLDADRASLCGITKYDIQKELNIALSGQRVSTFIKDGSEYPIVVSSDISSKEELENLAIKSSITQNKVILKQLAQIELQSHIPSIKRHNGNKTITVYSDVKEGYSSVKIEQALREAVKGVNMDNVELSFDGEKSKIDSYFGDMGILAVFAALVIFGILLVQFKSFSQPLIILITIPLSVIGSLIGLFVTRQPLSFTSVLGIVSLMGIVVNNAIVLLDFINNERAEGMPVDQACIQAADKRLRPIMLTTITTVVGLTPLLLKGDSLFTPLSISLVSGLMVSTLLTLVIIPVIYSSIEKRIDSIKNSAIAA